MEEDPASKNTLRAQATCAAFHCRMKEYFDAEKYTDVSITCQDRVFRCHRLVLAAASEYFDAMFGGNFKESRAEDVVLHDINRSGFESALHYMYTGMVPVIGDENVYDLLSTAIFLNLRNVEERCIHYLTQKNVPMNSAVEIFLLASVIGNKTLIWCTSQSILKHLPHVSKDDLFLKMSFKELDTLLRFAIPDRSPEEEHVLLNTICRWVSNQICVQEGKESLFLKLTQNVCFRHIPVVFSEVYRDVVFQPDVEVTDSDVENLDHSLYVYVDLEYQDPNARSSSLTAPFSRKKSYRKWHPAPEIVPSIKYMRTVVHDNQLYSFQLDRMQDKQFAFKASPSVDFSENVRSLTMLPLDSFYIDAKPHLSMCCQKNGIYACSWYSQGLFYYNCKQDEWFPISFSTKEELFLPALITMCHNQLYIMGSESNSSEVNILRTYDDRAGKYEAGSQCNWHHSYHSEICTHKERIYVSDCRSNHTHVDVFDPVANKWDKIFDFNRPSMVQERSLLESHRLVSFENKLYIFTTINLSQPFNNLQYIDIVSYDSFADEWNTSWDRSFSLSSAVEEKRNYKIVNLFNKQMTDVLVYKPPQ